MNMYTHEGHRMGDAWYHVDDDEGSVHMFYLAWPTNGRGQVFVGHAVSRDLVRWERLSSALEPGPPGSWDDLKLCTGSVIRRDGRYWLAYAATNTSDSSTEEPFRVQRAGMAVSDDLVVWHKLPENPLTQARPPHYEEMSSGQRKMVHWRDPFLLDDGEAVCQFVCARRGDGDVTKRGTVALTKSTDMRTWEILPPVEHERIAEEMEVPQVYRINGRWYLVFCTLGRFLTPSFSRRFQGAIPDRSNFSMVGSSPFGPFHIHGTGQIVRHPPDYYFYAAQLVNFRRNWYLLATIHDDVSERISDPVPVCGDETGIHECS
jgi:beta-fructofuranosidase